MLRVIFFPYFSLLSVSVAVVAGTGGADLDYFQMGGAQWGTTVKLGGDNRDEGFLQPLCSAFKASSDQRLSMRQNHFRALQGEVAVAEPAHLSWTQAGWRYHILHKPPGYCAEAPMDGSRSLTLLFFMFSPSLIL